GMRNPNGAKMHSEDDDDEEQCPDCVPAKLEHQYSSSCTCPSCQNTSFQMSKKVEQVVTYAQAKVVPETGWLHIQYKSAACKHPKQYYTKEIMMPPDLKEVFDKNLPAYSGVSLITTSLAGGGTKYLKLIHRKE